MAKERPSSPPSMTRRGKVGAEESQGRRSHIDSVLEGPDGPGIRRRSSTLTDFSIDEARKTFKSSTDDILLPKVSLHGNTPGLEPSHWHSAPLAFALFPAIGGLLFKNGSSIITDIMLLGLAAVFLNWSVRLPWFVLGRIPTVARAHMIAKGMVSLGTDGSRTRTVQSRGCHGKRDRR